MGVAKKRRTVKYFQQQAQKEIVALVVEATEKLKNKQVEKKKLKESIEEKQDEVTNIVE